MKILKSQDLLLLKRYVAMYILSAFIQLQDVLSV